MTILIGSNAVQRWKQEIHHGNFGWRHGWMVLKDTKSFIQSVPRGWSNQYFYARLSECLCPQNATAQVVYLASLAADTAVVVPCQCFLSSYHNTHYSGLKSKPRMATARRTWQQASGHIRTAQFSVDLAGSPNENFLGQLEHVFHMPDAQATAITAIVLLLLPCMASIRTTCISRQLQFKSGRFCCSKVLLPACPCWWQLAHLN